MKMFCTILALLAVPVLLRAQELRGDFERWDSLGANMFEPSGWQFASILGGGRDSNAYSGTGAVKLWNWYNEVPGQISLGRDPGLSGISQASGLPVSGVPRKLTGYYKFVPGTITFGEDSAIVIVLLKRYDPVLGQPDTLSYVKAKLGAADAWSRFEIAIPAPAGGMMPDSVDIRFASSEQTFCTDGYCCYFSLDDIALESASGVPYRMEQGKLVPATVAPNPFRSAATISFDGASDGHYRISLVDASGRAVREIESVGTRVDLGRGDLSSGSYLFIVRDADGATVASGRFVVD